MKLIVLGAAIGVAVLSGTSSAAVCHPQGCLPGTGAIKVGLCESGDPDCDRICAPFDDPIICAP